MVDKSRGSAWVPLPGPAAPVSPAPASHPLPAGAKDWPRSLGSWTGPWMAGWGVLLHGVPPDPLPLLPPSSTIITWRLRKAESHGVTPGGGSGGPASRGTYPRCHLGTAARLHITLTQAPWGHAPPPRAALLILGPALKSPEKTENLRAGGWGGAPSAALI